MVKQEIHVMVEKMIEKLRQSERQLAREVETATDIVNYRYCQVRRNQMK